MTPEVGDLVTNGFDRGEVIKITNKWVCLDSTERGEPRWVLLEAFEQLDWWTE